MWLPGVTLPTSVQQMEVSQDGCVGTITTSGRFVSTTNVSGDTITQVFASGQTYSGQAQANGDIIWETGMSFIKQPFTPTLTSATTVALTPAPTSAPMPPPLARTPSPCSNITGYYHMKLTEFKDVEEDPVQVVVSQDGCVASIITGDGALAIGHVFNNTVNYQAFSDSGQVEANGDIVWSSGVLFIRQQQAPTLTTTPMPTSTLVDQCEPISPLTACE